MRKLYQAIIATISNGFCKIVLNGQFQKTDQTTKRSLILNIVQPQIKIAGMLKRFMFLFAMMLTLFVGSLKAQFSNVTISGFNADLVANGVGAPSTSSTTDIDGTGTGYVFVDGTYKFASVCANGVFTTGIAPSSGTIASTTASGLTYSLQSYSANNAIRIPATGTGTGNTTIWGSSTNTSIGVSASNIYLLCVSGGGAITSGVTITVTFSDASTQVWNNITTADWCNTSTASTTAVTTGSTAVAYNKITTTSYLRAQLPGTCVSLSTCQYFAEMSLPILVSNYSKTISSITVNKTTTGQALSIYALGAQAPCTTPTAQPTLSSSQTATLSSITSGFSAASPVPSGGYLVVRYPTNAATTAPVNGTTYSTGNTLGLGTVVQSAATSTTTFTASGLSAGTQYDFYVYSYNLASTCGGPVYNTAGNIHDPNMYSYATNTCGSMSGTIPIGPAYASNVYTSSNTSGGFPTLTAALTYVNNNGIGGATTWELQGGGSPYVSTSEAFPLTFSANACINSTSTLLVRPASGATGLIITSANTTATIDLNGATNVTIDGRPGGSGTSTSGTSGINGSGGVTGALQIINTSTSAIASVRIINDAQNNNVKYCNIQGVTTTYANPPTAGVVFIGGTTGTNGNDNNSIIYCDIHAGSTLPITGIAAYNSTTSGTAANNDNVTIDHNNIYDFSYLSTSTNNTTGIYVWSGNNSFIITNNSIYETTTRAINGTGVFRFMWIGPNASSAVTYASGFNIANNYLGGTTAQCGGGTPFTLTSTTTQRLVGMDLNIGNGTQTTINANTIQNISFQTANVTTGTGGTFVGIYLGYGYAAITSNTIGGSSANSIKVIPTASAGAITGIGIQGGAAGYTIPVTGNIINNITVAATTAAIYNSINGIFVAATAPTFNIGGTTAALGNTISNLTDGYSSSTGITTSAIAAGINISGALAAAPLIQNNTVYNIVSFIPQIGSNATASVEGIWIGSTTTANASILNNTVYNLFNNATVATALSVSGITVNASTTGTTTISNNWIHSLNLPNSTVSAAVPLVTAINLTSGAVNIYNNMIRLGLDATGAAIAKPISFTGIKKGIGQNANILFNSVYIGGTGVTTNSTAANTYALYKTTSGSTDVIEDNIFVNVRTNSGSFTPAHYGVYLNNATGLTLNYNNYQTASTTGATTGNYFGYTGSANQTAWASGWVSGDANSVTGDPNFNNPTGTAVNTGTLNLDINSSGTTPIEGSGLSFANITTDIHGNSRGNYTPTDIGADAGNFTGTGTACTSITLNGGNSVVSTIFGCPASATLSLSGGNLSSVYGLNYQWQSRPTGVGTYSNIAGATSALYATTFSAATDFQLVATCVANSSTAISTSISANLPTTVGSSVGFLPIALTYASFNTDVIANGKNGASNVPSRTTTNFVDGAGYVFYDASYSFDGSTYPTISLPINGQVIGSSSTGSIPGLIYKLQPASTYNPANGTGDNLTSTGNNNNVLQLRFGTTLTGTLTLSTPTSGTSVYVLAVSGSGATTMTCVVNFSDGSSHTFTGLTVQDWYSGTPYNQGGFGRAQSTGIDAPISTGPRMYDIPLTLSASEYSKLVTSITCTNTGASASTSNVLNIFAVTMAVTTPAAFCASSATSVLLFNAPTSGVTYSWLSSTDGTNYVTASGGTAGSSATNPYPSTTAQYYTTSSSITGVNYFICQATCNSGGFTAQSNPVTITMNPVPTVSVTPASSTYCSGGSGVNLTASGTATTFSWTPNTGLNQQTGSVVSASPSSTTTYTVTGYSSAGCLSATSPSATVTYSASPGITISSISASPTSVCSGGTSNLLVNATGTGTLNYTWTGTGLSATNISNPTATPSSTTTYTASVSNGTCTSSQFVIVTVGSLSASIIPSNNSASYCGNIVNTLTGLVTGGGTPYTYSWTPTTGLYTDLAATIPYNGSSTNIVYAKAASTTHYTLTVTDNCSNQTTATYTATILPSPTITPPSAATYCAGNSSTLTLTASGASSYIWSPNNGLSSSTSSSVTASPTSTTTYTITGTGSNGCTNTATVTVTYAIAPSIASVTATPANVCSGGGSSLGVTLAAPSTYANATYSTGTGSGDYLTNVTLGSINNTTGASASPFNTYYNLLSTNLSGGNSYTISGTIANGGTEDVAVWIDYNQNGIFETSEKLGEQASLSFSLPFTVPTSALNGTTRMRVRNVYNTTGIDPYASYTYGEVEDYNVVISGGSTVSYTYGWTESGSGGTLNSNNAASVTASTINTTTTYTATVSANGCSTTGTAIVTVSALAASITPSISGSYCASLINTLTATVSGGGTPYASYVWSSSASSVANGVAIPGLFTDAAATTNYKAGDNASVVYSNTTTATTYTLTVTDNCGSVSTATYTPTLLSAPTVSVSPHTATYCAGTSGSQALTVTGTATSLAWTSVSGTSSLTATTGTPVTASPTATTTYTVTGSWATNSCTSTDVATVYVNSVPSFPSTNAVTATEANFCNGQSTTLTANVTNASSFNGLTYTWSESGGGSTLVSNNAASVTATGLTGIVTYSVKASVSCGNVTSTVVVDPKLTAGTASSFAALTVTGYNQRVIAWGNNGGSANPASVTCSTTIDGAGYNFYDASYTYDGNYPATRSSSTVLHSLPVNGQVVSNNVTGLLYQLQEASTGNNTALQLVYPASLTGTLTLATPTKATALYLLATSGSGAATMNSVVYFTDGTTQSFSNTAIPDWYTGTNYSQGGFGRVGTGGFDANAVSGVTPYMYDVSLILADTNYNKQVQKVVVTNSTSGLANNHTSVINIFGVTAATNTNTFCGGLATSVTLFNPATTSGINYQWQTSTDNISYNNVSSGTGATTTTYTNSTATGTNYYKCLATCPTGSPAPTSISNYVTENIYTLPTVSVTASTPTYCAGGSGVKLTGSGADVYHWSPTGTLSAPVGNPVIATPTTTTTYTVTGTNSTTGCTNTATTTVAYSSSTGIVISSISATPANVCTGGSSQLQVSATGSGTLTYTWTPNTNITSASIANPIATPTVSTTYTATITDGTCTSVGTATVTVAPLSVSITPSITASSYCAARINKLTATVSGGGNPYTYSWYANTAGNYTGLYTDAAATIPYTGGSVSFLYAYTATTATYTLTVNDFCGSSNNTATYTATILSAPTVSITPSSSNFCAGSSSTVTLTASSNDNLATFSWSPTKLLSSYNTASVTTTPVESIVYTVTATGSNTCTNTASSTINYINLPSVSIATPAAICSGGSTQLQATASIPAPTYCIPTISSSLHYFGSNAFSIKNVAGTTNYISDPTAGPLSTTNYYKDNSTTLTSGSLVAGNTYSFSATSGGAYEGFAFWIDFDQNGIFDDNEMLYAYYSGQSTSGYVYTGTFTVPATAYNGTSKVRARINWAGAYNSTGNAPYSCNPGNTDGSSTYGETRDYTISITGGTTLPSFGYSWTLNASLSATNIANPVASPTTTTSYVATSTYRGCASATATQSVTVNPLPTASISGTTAVTYNSTAPSITFTGANGTAPYTFTYTINNGSNLTASGLTGNTATVAAPTGVVGSFVYTLVSVHDASSTSCTQTQTGTATVTVNKATPTISVTGTQSFIYNGRPQGPSTIIYNGDGSTSLLYTNQVGTATYSSATAPTANGSYQVVASATAGTNYIAVTSSAFTFTISGSAYTWIGGTVSHTTDWNTGTNWAGGSVPTSTSDVTILPGTTYYPLLTATSNVHNLYIEGGTVSLSGQSLTVAGEVYGAGVMVGSTTASLTMNGTVASTLTFRTTGAADTLLGKLTLSNTGKVSLGTGLGITTLLSLNNAGAVLDINGNHLTLKSTSIANSAEFGVVTAGATIIDGTKASPYTATKVTVERFIPKGMRNYRDLGPSVANAGSVFANWQESGAGSSTYTYGVYITGKTGTPGYAAYSSKFGFDLTTNGNLTPSLYSCANSTWKAVDSTVSNPSGGSIFGTKGWNLDPFQGLRLIVRGSRNFNMGTNPASMPTATIIRATGTLITGNVTFNAIGSGGTVSGALTSTYGLTAGGGWSLIANPYACPIAWDKLLAHNGGGTGALNATYYFLDPTYQSAGLSRYVTVQYFGSNLTVNNRPSGVATDAACLNIQPGQGFWVFHTIPTTSPTLSIVENDKVVGGTHTAVFGTNKANMIKAAIWKDINGVSTDIDGVVATFDNSYSHAIGAEDAKKLMNGGENIAITESNTDLSIDGIAVPSVGDEIALKLENVIANTTYELKVDATQFATPGLQAFIKDAYLNTTVTAETVVSFTPTADATTYKGRFSIVFKQAKVVPVAVGKGKISAYPNPVTERSFTLQLSNIAAGKYNVVLINNLGQEVFSTPISHKEGSTSETITMDKALSSGLYTLVLRSADSKGVYNTELLAK